MQIFQAPTCVRMSFCKRVWVSVGARYTEKYIHDQSDICCFKMIVFIFNNPRICNLIYRFNLFKKNGENICLSNLNIFQVFLFYNDFIFLVGISICFFIFITSKYFVWGENVFIVPKFNNFVRGLIEIFKNAKKTMVLQNSLEVLNPLQMCPKVCNKMCEILNYLQIFYFRCNIL